MLKIPIKKIRQSVALIILGFPLLSSAEVAAKPALFGDTLSQLKQNVKLPADFGGGFTTLAVYCQTDVADSGDLHNTQCYQHPKVADLQAQTMNVLKDARFEPAQVDGKPVPVRMQFRVVFSRSGNQPDIMLLANLGTLQKDYGVDYIAPQERLDQSAWFQTYQNNPWAKGKAFFNDGRLTRVKGVVKTTGKVRDVTTLDARGSGKRDAQVIEDALKQSRFVPGFVDNKPIEMHYVAVLNYAD
jgi:Gram-negative bacterial TonB protein C-terminal